VEKVKSIRTIDFGGEYKLANKNKKHEKKLTEDQSFKEKKKKDKLTDDVPDEDVKLELREERHGSHSKDDSSSEEKYKEDFQGNKDKDK